MKRIKDNVILHKSPLDLNSYTVGDLKPEYLYADKRYNVCDSLQEAAQIQKKSWKLSSMDTLTDRHQMKELKNAPFCYNHIRESKLEHTFGLPLLSTVEIIKDEGNIIQLQETYDSEIYNEMTFGNSINSRKLENLIKNYKDLKNYSEDELKMYSEAMRFYQDNSTFNSYLNTYQDGNISSNHYYYFKTSTLDSFIRECIITPLKSKYEQIGRKFNQTLVRDFKLDKAFEFVRSVYFMEAGKEMTTFSYQLFDKLDSYEKCDDEHEINGILQESLRELTTDEEMDMLNNLEVVFPEKLVIPKYVITEITALDHLGIAFVTEWPMNIIFDQKSMEDYNQIFNFLMKIQRVIYVLSKKDLWKHRHEELWNFKKRDRKSETYEEREYKDMVEENAKLYHAYQHQFFLFQRELLHFAKNLETFIKTRVLLHCTAEFERNLKNVENMDRLIRFHTGFLSKVMDMCLLGQQSKQLRDTILNVLNNGIQLRECFKHFSKLEITDERMKEEIHKSMLEFSRIKESHKLCMRFITGFMEKKTKHNLMTHLDDAYCRLNFNYFYSSRKK